MTILFSIFCFLIVFYIVFDRLTYKYINPYKLIMVFGKKGSGKTTFLTKVAIKNIKKGIKVFSTVDIAGTYLIDPDNCMNYRYPENCVILIDEVGMIWDNRDFKKFNSKTRDWFKYQRHHKNTVYLFSQTFDVDLKIRNLTDEMYLLENKARVFSVAKRILKIITIDKDQNTGNGSLVDSFEFAPLLSSRGRIITFIPRWTSFFDSSEPLPLPPAPEFSRPLAGDSCNDLSTFAWLRRKSALKLSEANERVSQVITLKHGGSGLSPRFSFKRWLIKTFTKPVDD